MSNEKILSAISNIERRVREYHSVSADRMVAPGIFESGLPSAAHLVWMCNEMRVMLDENRREKLMRWLGFAQGALWAMGYATIDEMKDWNRPDPEPGQ